MTAVTTDRPRVDSGIFLAITGDGFSLPELRRYCEFLRRELLMVRDVKKVDLFSEQDEVVCLEISRLRLIRAMFWTAGPAFLTAMIVFAVLGLRVRDLASSSYVASELSKLDQLFWITPLNLIPLLVLVVLSIRKVPASLAILFSALLAGRPGGVSASASDVALRQRSGSFGPGGVHKGHLDGVGQRLSSQFRHR
jgi:hypothetical protein